MPAFLTDMVPKFLADMVVRGFWWAMLASAIVGFTFGIVRAILSVKANKVSKIIEYLLSLPSIFFTYYIWDVRGEIFWFIILLIWVLSPLIPNLKNRKRNVDQTSFLWIPNYVKVKQFGGQAVEWIAPPFSMAPIKVGVPSGEFTLIIDTVVSDNNAAGIPDIRDKLYTKYFEPGKGYQLTYQFGEIVLVDL
jgi:hypothetical protein